MLKVYVTDDEIKWCKSEMQKFDKQKSYNKIDSGNNWIGLLGELKFNQWLINNKIKSKWVEFVKSDYNEPDFYILDRHGTNEPYFERLSIDVKTTFDTKMWIQKPTADIYILARLNREDLNYLIFVSFIKGKKIQDLIDMDKVETIKREGRDDFLINITQMKPFDIFLTYLKNYLYGD